MFSLIITIVSIALVVALIAATMYYGSDTLTRGRAAAEAAAIVSGGEQVIAAMTAFQATTGRYPNTLEELITLDYLKSFPDLASAGFEIIGSAHAAPVDGYGDWLYDHDTPHLAYVGAFSLDTCAEVNAQVTGRPIVLSLIDPDPRAQCVVKGAQAPVVVFRHPGERDFAGWDEHPRIPAIGPSGILKNPVFDEGTCMVGCGTEPDAGEGEGPTPEEPVAGGAQVEFMGPTLADFLASGSWDAEALAPTAPSDQSLPVLATGSFGGYYEPECRPILKAYYNGYDWTMPGETGSLLVNSEPYRYSRPELLSGITMTAKLVKVRQGEEELSTGVDPQPLYLAVFNNGNWETYPQTATVTTTFANDLTSADYMNDSTVDNVPVTGYGAILNGDIGFCADTVSGSGPGILSTYRVDMTFSKQGDSDSESLYLIPLGF